MTKLYVSVPAQINTNGEATGDAPNAEAKDVELHSRVGDAFRVLMGKQEMEADPEKLKDQVTGYISLVRGAVAEAEKKQEKFQVSSVKLGLTVTVGGNIGLASAEAEASIEIEFARS